MPRDQDDIAHLWDMWRAAADIQEFTDAMSFVEFSSDKRTRLATERQLLVIGEAAGRVSSEFRNAHPEIAWSSIIGLRNVLAHEYGEVLVERIWLVVERHIPELLSRLEVATQGEVGRDT